MTQQQDATPQSRQPAKAAGASVGAAAGRPARSSTAGGAATAASMSTRTVSRHSSATTTQRARTVEPLLWLAFSAGGVFAALLIPSLLFLFGVAFPLGWFAPPDHARLLALVGHPLVRLAVFLLCSLSLVHWAHRFRYTLYDGLQIKHLNELVNLFCYGSAVVGSIIAAYLLIRLP